MNSRFYLLYDTKTTFQKKTIISDRKKSKLQSHLSVCVLSEVSTLSFMMVHTYYKKNKSLWFKQIKKK